MSKLEQAARQALEALEWEFGGEPCGTWDAITALREALAEPELNLNCKSVQKRLATVWGYVKAEQAEQEPVAIGTEWKPCMKLPVVVHVREQREGESHVSTREGITPVKPDDLIMRGVAGEEYPIGRELFNKTYTFDTAAPVRTKDLTDDEIDEIFAEHGTIPNTKAVRSVIAADREKNK